MILKSLKKFDNGVVVDAHDYNFTVYVGDGDKLEGRCVFDVDWNELYRECHLKGRLFAYKTGRASVDVLWQSIQKKKEVEYLTLQNR